MNVRNITLTILAGAGAYALARALLAEQQRINEGANAHVVSVVEKTLHQHEGEGESNPIVHAFEEALQNKAHA